MVEDAPSRSLSSSSVNRVNDKPSKEASNEELNATNKEHEYYAHKFSPIREFLFVSLMMSAQMVTQACLGQSICAMYIIGDTLKVPKDKTQELSWHVAGYSLTVGTFILIAGRFGDTFGHKKMFVGAYAWYTLWCLITGVSYYARNNIFFSVCRGLLGIGPSFLMPNALAILGRAYPPGLRRNMVFSLLGACAPSGFVLGALFGALFAQLATWPWAYYVACIVGVFLTILSYLVIPDEKIEIENKWGRIDVWGAITGVTGLVLFNVAWNQGPVVGWKNPYTYILLIVGVAFFAVFVFFERRVSHPLVPVKELPGSVIVVLGVVALGWSAFGVWVFYFWQEFLVLQKTSPLEGVARFTVAPVAGVIASLVTVILFHKNFSVAFVLAIALAAFTVAPILLATNPIRRIYWAQQFVSMLIAPFGMDMSFPAATIMMANLLPPEHQGIGGSLVSTVVNYSISIGLGIAGTAEVYIAPGATTIEEKLKGYRAALYCATGFGGLGLIICLALLARDLQKNRSNRTRA